MVERRVEDQKAEPGAAHEQTLALVAVVMGSTSDWETMKHASLVLAAFGVVHRCEVVSAHRTPARLSALAKGAVTSGYEVIIAGAGGAAHLPGMIAASTPLPVLGVPVASRALSGLDSLLSIVQMPAGIPVGTLAIGQAGATNAGLLAVAILANSRPELRSRLVAYRQAQTDRVLAAALPENVRTGESLPEDSLPEDSLPEATGSGTT